jgi:hypothetical protein
MQTVSVVKTDYGDQVLSRLPFIFLKGQQLSKMT